MTTLQNNLTNGPGMIWIMIKLDNGWFRGDEDRAIADDIVNFILDNNIGDVDGESSGAGEMDINFMVSNKRVAAQRLDEFIRSTYSEMVYYISDHYVPMFET